ncbi:MAG TPA: response regulator transcription factor, partial [Chitinophagaceae bacterium]|nr:response regulator transcription factor [Chitinophagaceae bacterium]
MIKVMIIDDHPLVADGIQMMLKDVDYLCVVATVKTAAGAIQFLDNNEPEIILLDINLPDMDGLHLCNLIREKNKYSKIIVLTSANDSSIITQMLHLGANGYLLKNMERDEFLEAINKVLEGKIFLSTAANEKVLEQFSSVSTALYGLPALT